MPKFTASLNLPKYDTAPASPSNGDVYYNTTDNKVYSRINGAWVDLAAGGGSGNVVYYQNDAPSTANDGDIWIDANDETMTATGPQGPTGATGATGAAGTAGANAYNTPIITQATSRDIALTDLGDMIECTSATAMTLTVRSDATVSGFAVGDQIMILQSGAGQVTIAGNGATVNGTPGLKLRAQWSSATLIKRAANTWVLVGDVTA
jgi:hypothetical protein